MIIQVYDTIDRVVKVKIVDGAVYYSDSVDYPNYIKFERLLTSRTDLHEWNRRISSIPTDKGKAKDIKEDMLSLGHTLVRELIQ